MSSENVKCELSSNVEGELLSWWSVIYISSDVTEREKRRLRADWKGVIDKETKEKKFGQKARYFNRQERNVERKSYKEINSVTYLGHSLFNFIISYWNVSTKIQEQSDYGNL